MSNLPAIKEFSKELAAHEKAFSSVLPAHIPAKKFMRTVVGAIQNNPSILKCDRQSILNACQRSAQDGLILDGREAALVQYGNQAQYMPMIAGVLKKLRNSGAVLSITAQIVHKNDPFSYNPGTNELNHNPDWFGDDRGEPIGVYALATLKDGSKQVEVMNKRQIEKVKAVSKGSSRGPWQQWEEEMWRKSVLRRIAKYLPSSADTDQMFMHDDDNYDVDKPDYQTPAQKSAADLNAELNAASAPRGEPDRNTGEVIEHQPHVADDDDVI